MAGHHELQIELRRLPATADLVEPKVTVKGEPAGTPITDTSARDRRAGGTRRQLQILARRADLHIKSHPQHVRCRRWGSGIDAQVKLAPRASAGVRQQ